MRKYTYLLQCSLFLCTFANVSCVKKGSIESNHTVVKTEVEEHNILAASFIEASDRLLDAAYLESTGEKKYWEEARAAKTRGERVLFLPNIERLNEKQAQAIAETARMVYLHGVVEISPQVAKMLLKGGPQSLSLNGLKTLDQATAKELSTFYGSLKQATLSLNGLTELPFSVAQELAQIRNGSIELRGLTELSQETVDLLEGIQPTKSMQKPIFVIPNVQKKSEE